MIEPLYCCFCGAYDKECSCGYPDEDTPLADLKHCEACGSEFEPYGRCPECDP